jgi:hypothetical protein
MLEHEKCLRCGKTINSAPQQCAFHPFIVPFPGNILGSLEWLHCRNNCSTSSPPCYITTSHSFTMPSVSPSSRFARQDKTTPCNSPAKSPMTPKLKQQNIARIKLLRLLGANESQPHQEEKKAKSPIQLPYPSAYISPQKSYSNQLEEYLSQNV